MHMDSGDGRVVLHAQQREEQHGLRGRGLGGRGRGIGAGVGLQRGRRGRFDRSGQRERRARSRSRFSVESCEPGVCALIACGAPTGQPPRQTGDQRDRQHSQHRAAASGHAGDLTRPNPRPREVPHARQLRDALAGPVEVVVLLREADPQLGLAVLRVHVEGAAGHRGHAAAAHEHVGGLAVAREAGLAHVDHEVVAALRRQAAQADRVAGGHGLVALAVVVGRIWR